METSYDPRKVNISVDGTILTGFSADGVVAVTKNEDSVTPNVGCKGDVVYDENANESGTIAVTLMQTSPSLSLLRRLAADRTKFRVTVSDANEDEAVNISASNCRILKMPDLSRQKNSSTVTVNIYVPRLAYR